MRADAFHIRIVTREEAFRDLQPAWNRLLSESSYDHINLTHAWLYGAWKHYRQFDSTARIAIFCIYDGQDNMTAILPLMVSVIPFKRVLRVKRISFLCSDFNEYGGFIIKSGFEDTVVRFFFERILKNKAWLRWDMVMLKNIAETNPQFELMIACMKNLKMRTEVKEKTKYYFVNTEQPFESYFNALSPGLRNNLNTSHNRLKRYCDSHREQWEIVENDALDQEKLKTLTAMNRTRQARRGRKSLVESQSFADFMSDFCLNAPDKVQLFSLKINGTILAYSLNLKYGNTVMYWSPSFDERFESLSPGQLLLHALIKSCFRNRVRCFDFLRGDSAYKARWASGFVRGFQIRAFNRSKVLFKILGRVKEHENG